MKRMFFILTALVSFTLAKAQIKEGTILYDQKTNMHRAIQDEQMKAMIPEFRTAKYILQFSDSVSMYKLVPEDEAPDPFAGGGGRMVIRMNPGGSGDLYKNFAQAKSVQTSEVGGKNFLIIDTIRQTPWKLGTETKQILGYTCHKATRKVSQQGGPIRRVMMGGGGGTANVAPPPNATPAAPVEIEVVAWYADDIVSPVGPENYGQLPGVILQLDIDNGALVYSATEVKKSVNQKELKEPTKGKPVTRQEFMKIMSDMMGNMQINGSGGGVVRF